MCKEHHHCSHHQAQECGHCHHEHGNARLPLRIGAAVLLFAAAVSGLLPPAAGTALFVAAWFVAGADIVYAAGRNILRGKWLDENALMTIATLGAVFLGEYPEAAMVMILFQSGEYLQHKAVESSKRSIAELMDIRPDYACREENGTAVRRRPEEIAVGDVIIVKSGEKIPLDGLVTDGEATVDTSALTGESLPRRLVPGSEALSGFINTNGLLKIKVSKPFGESTAAKILELVEHADARQSPYGKVHYPFCPLLHAGGGGCRYIAGFGAAACRSRHRVCRMAAARVNISCYLLSLRTGHFGSAHLFCRHRRRFPQRHSDQRQQLSGNAGKL